MESELQPKPGQECAEPNKASRLVVVTESIFSTKSPCIDLLLKEQKHTFTATLSLIFKGMPLSR